MFESIPQELKVLRQWVCHKYPSSKMPLCAYPDAGGRLGPASCKEQSTWASFGDAVKAVQNYGATGIGIQLANGIVGVDIDHCVDGGELSSFAQEIVDTLQSYTEISPSGTGVHILCKGRMPTREGNRDSMLGLEMYDKGRYFTVTGTPYLDPDGQLYSLRDCTAELDAIQKNYLYKEVPEQIDLTQKKQPQEKTPPAINSAQVGNAAEQPRQVRDLTDQQILEIAFKSKNGAEFKRLYEGNYSTSEVPLRKDGTPDQSAVDLQFANYLAYWFNCDLARMDAVFRSSKLYRKKWDRSVGGGKTYGEMTLQRAAKGRTSTFIPYERHTDRESPPLPEPPPAPASGGAAVPPPVSPPEKAPAITPDPSKYTLDDTGNAYRFRDKYWRHLKYDHVNGQWYCWDGKQWAIDQSGEIKRCANKLLEEMEKEAKEGGRDELQKHVRKTRSSKYKEAMIKEAQPLEGIPILPNELNKYKALLNIQNGILNLKTGELLPHRREYKLSMLADIEYDPQAKCPRWMQFLDEITCGDIDLSKYLQRMVGYCLTASTKEQCVFFLWGIGGNGKSKFIDTITSLFGDYTKTCAPETVMIKDRNGSNAYAELARMKSVRLITTSEPDGGCRLAEGLLKRMTGEDVITARQLYREAFDFRPEFKIMMATNVKPIITGSDQGIWRRVRLIPFTAQFPPEKMDKDLGEKLLAEKKGVFAWAVKGAIDWYKEGMPYCVRVDNAVADYRKEMDRMKQFVDDCLIEAIGHALPASKIYAVYRAWCEENGERYPMSNSKFSAELQDNYHFIKRKTSRFNEYINVDFSDTGIQYVQMTPASPRN